MRRSARVVAVARVTEPASGAAVIEVRTDYPRRSESALYLRLGSPWPEVGASIYYGDRHAFYGGQVAEKVGLCFDPDAPLH